MIIYDYLNEVIICDNGNSYVMDQSHTELGAFLANAKIAKELLLASVSYPSGGSG